MLKVSCICVSQISRNMHTKMAKKSKKRSFWPSLLCYYEKTMTRRCMKLSAFSFITELSNILKNQINTLNISALTRKTANFTRNAYAIPTKTFRCNAHREKIVTAQKYFRIVMSPFIHKFSFTFERILEKSSKSIHPIHHTTTYQGRPILLYNYKFRVHRILRLKIYFYGNGTQH